MEIIKKVKREKGAFIVEATFVFPIMFFILFFLLFLGNAYYQRSVVDNYVSSYALKGAANCTNPLLNKIGESVPTSNNNIKPYRYYIGGMTDVTGKTQSELCKAIEDAGTGFFLGMESNIKNCKVRYNNHVLYSTYSVEVSYAVKFPIRFIFKNDATILELNSKAEVPVSDTPEFIRNVDMAVDYLESNDKVQKAMAKAKEVLGKFGNFVK